MTPDRSHTIATLFVIATGALWGFYWLPVRRLGDLGLTGAWGTAAIVAVAALVLLPFAVRARKRLVVADRIGLAAVALGGAAFALYSVGLLYGRVAIIVILFFLTPVWSTLIGRLAMGWPVTGTRLAALAVGTAGLILVLGADGEMPLPQGLGEWLGLISGIVWSIATTGIRARSDTGPGETAFVFAFGALVAALVLAPLLEPLPTGIPAPVQAVGWAFAAGALWWGVSMMALMWATARLEPARVGILLMAEVLMSTASAAVLLQEIPAGIELAGGALVVLAGVLEVWPSRSGGHGTRLVTS